MPQRILVTGGDGLLAYALRGLASADWEMIFLSRGDFDLTAAGQMRERLDALRPEVVINTAAYNLVERCEQERELSWAINATGPEALAKLCAEKNIRLIHYGTDYVFDGAKGSPYVETDAPNPLNHYGTGCVAQARRDADKLGFWVASDPDEILRALGFAGGSRGKQFKGHYRPSFRSNVFRRPCQMDT
jgi:dTDP-4-dehydrorhamnose reductase